MVSSFSGNILTWLIELKKERQTYENDRALHPTAVIIVTGYELKCTIELVL